MISIFLLVVLLWSFYIGYSRGLILQSFYNLVSLVAILVASQAYRGWGDKLSLLVPYASAQEGAFSYFFPSKYLFDLDKVFYAGLGFLAVYTLVYSLGRFVGIFLHLLPLAVLDERKYNLIAGFLSVLVTAFGLQMLLTILATVPLESLQNQLNASGLARFLISHVPIMSGLLQKLWLTNLIG